MAKRLIIGDLSNTQSFQSRQKIDLTPSFGKRWNLILDDLCYSDELWFFYKNEANFSKFSQKFQRLMLIVLRYSLNRRVQEWFNVVFYRNCKNLHFGFNHIYFIYSSLKRARFEKLHTFFHVHCKITIICTFKSLDHFQFNLKFLCNLHSNSSVLF